MKDPEINCCREMNKYSRNSVYNGHAAAELSDRSCRDFMWSLKGLFNNKKKAYVSAHGRDEKSWPLERGGR